MLSEMASVWYLLTFSLSTPDTVIAGYQAIIMMWSNLIVAEIRLSLSLIYTFMQSFSMHSYAHSTRILKKESAEPGECRIYVKFPPQIHCCVFTFTT